MKKKAYIAPMTEVLNMDVVDMMATSVSVSDEITGADAEMAGERRGSWGNRWE